MSYWSREEEPSPYLRGFLAGTLLGAGAVAFGFLLLRRSRHKPHAGRGHGPCGDDDGEESRHQQHREGRQSRSPRHGSGPSSRE